MYIKTLSYYNIYEGWSLEQINFKNISLLIGLSGAGKTRIIHAIRTLQEVANGKPHKGIKWKCIFLDKQQREVTWEGEIPTHYTVGSAIISEPPFIMEKISIDGSLIAERKEDETTYFNNTKTVKLLKSQSLLYLLSAEEEISPIVDSFQQVWLGESSLECSTSLPETTPQTIEKIKSSLLSPTQKLYLAYKYAKDDFNTIIEKYQTIFPFVSKVCFKIIANAEEIHYILHIDEKNVRKTIENSHISSGMNRTLNLLAMLYFSPPHSVFLIDEIENSFGLNCLSHIVEEMKLSPNMQFILTSHHPYIINNISPENWILVKRSDSEIKIEEIATKLSKVSKLDKFIQLINILDEVEDGEV